MSIVKHATRLWSEDDGFIVSAELVLIATILVLALIVGLTAVRNSLTAELIDISNAFSHANQSHSHGHDHDRSNSIVFSTGHHE